MREPTTIASPDRTQEGEIATPESLYWSTRGDSEQDFWRQQLEIAGWGLTPLSAVAKALNCSDRELIDALDLSTEIRRQVSRSGPLVVSLTLASIVLQIQRRIASELEEAQQRLLRERLESLKRQRGKVLKLFMRGMSIMVIAEHFSVPSESVRSLIADSLSFEGIHRIPDQLASRTVKIIGMRNKGYTLQEIADIFGITRERVRQLLLNVNYKPSKTRSDVKEAKVKTCAFCGVEFISTRRIKYCSKKCHQETFKYRNWSAEKRAKHKEIVLKWMRRNPEKAKEIQRRASEKYQRKSSKLKHLQRIYNELSHQ